MNITDKKEIAAILDKTGTLLELKGEDFFKIRAYYGAARALETSGMDITPDLRIEDLTGIKGIGTSIAGHIKQIIDEGTFPLYEQLKKDIPEGLPEMLRIPGLGPKKIKYLYDNLGIANIGQLEHASITNQLADLPGFGPKSVENILKGIEVIKKFSEKYLYGSVINRAESLLKKVMENSPVIRASLGGSVRRKKEIVKDIDMVASSSNPGEVMDYFTALGVARDVIARGDTKSSIRLDSGINVDLRIVEDSQYPYALHHFTGSKEHNTAMRSMAKKDGIKINEYGIFRNGKLIKCRSEEEIYGVFGMAYIPPELRENLGEIEAAKEGRLPELMEEKDIRGLFHIHSTYSDGKMTVEQVAAAVRVMGLEYAGISDHSKSARYAGGLQEEDLQRFLSEVDTLNKRYRDFKIFKGIESDILKDGSLDYGDDILKKFDFVIAAIHSNFNMKEEEMTARIIRALENRYTTILAHPTGRLLLSREPYQVDMERVINSAALNNVDLEINASPYRLDLDWRLCRFTRDRGVRIFINPDAHSLDALSDFRFGVNMARKGWLEKNDVVNTLSAREIEDYLREKKIKKGILQ
ncbi:MAG: DNA polymerase/3'-5' exonuclease PolX [Actinobacteria bacterium]|nr:DNA polymerase/3'-5' exonuclease PolX [Actinomycetota bacterium]